MFSRPVIERSVKAAAQLTEYQRLCVWRPARLSRQHDDGQVSAPAKPPLGDVEPC